MHASSVGSIGVSANFSWTGAEPPLHYFLYTERDVLWNISVYRRCVRRQFSVAEPVSHHRTLELVMFKAMRTRLKNRLSFQTVCGVAVTSEHCTLKLLHDVTEPTLGFSSFSGGENYGWSIKAAETVSLRGRKLKWISPYRGWFLVDVCLTCICLIGFSRYLSLINHS